MTSVGESETGGWISSFQSRMAGHTVLEDRRNYRDETTEWKLLTRCLPRGTGECLFSPLLAANIFRARAGGFQSADTQEVGALLGARQPPVSHSRCCHCPPSFVPVPISSRRQHTEEKKKSSPSYQSRTQYTSKTRRENTIPPQFRLNKQRNFGTVCPIFAFAHSVQTITACRDLFAGAQLTSRVWVNFVLNASVQFLIHTCAVYLFLRNK